MRHLRSHPRTTRRSRPLLAATVLVTLAVGAIVAGTWLASAGDDGEAALLPAPTTPSGPAAGPRPRWRIPEGFLRYEPRAAKPVADDEVRWVRSDDPRLPPLISPCGGPLPSDARRIAGRQLALVGPTLWKLERLVVYRGERAARAAMEERRRAMLRCDGRVERDGGRTQWRMQPLPIGAEAFFVTSRRRGPDGPLPGSHRGVVLRHGRTLALYVDYGPRTDFSPLADVANLRRDARAIARKLAAASWSAGGDAHAVQ